MSHILSGGHTVGFVFPFCFHVPCAVKMTHLSTAACQYVSYFVRRTYGWLCFSFLFSCPLCCQDDTSFGSSLSICLIFCQADIRLALFFLFVCVPCAVKMTHLLAAACQYVSYFVRRTYSWLCFSFLFSCPLCCQDDTSFGSSLSICLIFCQADIRLALFFLYVCVPCAVKMTHLSTAACQYVSYFVRWTYGWLCFSFLCVSLVLSR